MTTGRPSARGRIAILLLGAFGVPGCAAGGGPGAKFAEEPAPTTVEEAQAQLARAQEQIEGPKTPATGAVTSAPAASPPSGGAGSPASPAPTEASPAAPSPASAESTSSESAPSSRVDACALPCHAIASMRRAVDAICRIGGAQDARCVAARKILSDDEARVAPCGC